MPRQNKALWVCDRCGQYQPWPSVQQFTLDQATWKICNSCARQITEDWIKAHAVDLNTPGLLRAMAYADESGIVGQQGQSNG